MCGEVTEGFASIVEASKGMCWSADKSYLGHTLHIELMEGAVVSPAGLDELSWGLRSHSRP